MGDVEKYDYHESNYPVENAIRKNDGHSSIGKIKDNNTSFIFHFSTVVLADVEKEIKQF